MRKLIACLLLLLLVSPAWADSYPRAKGFVVTHYGFQVKLSATSKRVVVRDTVTLHVTRDGLRSVALDLCQYRKHAEPADPTNPCLPHHPYGFSPTTPAPTAAGTGMMVTSVKSDDGKVLAYQQTHDRLVVSLSKPLPAGSQVQFTVSYHGVPANGLVIGKNRHGVRGVFTNEWPDLAHNWLAVIDHPSMKATETMAVTAPSEYQVLSNGSKVKEIALPDDMRLTVWSEKVPICTWQFALVAAPMAVYHFGQLDGIPLSAWVFPQERAVGFQAFKKYTKPILSFYVNHIGPFSYEKLTQVQANGTYGGMELASDIFYGYRPSGPTQGLIAHEMAHQWFGDSVTERDWDDVWLSEGFATYFTMLYSEHHDGHDAFMKEIEASARHARKYALKHPSSTIVHKDLRHASNNLANAVQIYQGGAQVLQMLRGVLGTPTFWDGIQLYYRRHRNSTVTSLDFQHAMEDACRRSSSCPSYGRNLSWFFQEWLHRGGIMKVSGHWRYDSASHELVVTIIQAPNHGSFYSMPFQIRITKAQLPPRTAGKHKRPTAPAPPPILMVKGANSSLRISMAHAPRAVTLDPNHWVTLAKVQSRQLHPVGVTTNEN